MKVFVDSGRCQGHTLCSMIAPDSFELNDIDGKPVDGWVVIGRVVGVHIDERYIRNGLLDTAAMKPIARGGYHDYSVVTESFTMRRPASVDDPAARPRALEGAKAAR